MTTQARLSDPPSSHRAVAAIEANFTLQQNILNAATNLSACGLTEFDDTMLLNVVEGALGRRHQRNVIARARGRMEREGKFLRVGERENADGRMTVHYCLPWKQESLF